MIPILLFRFDRVRIIPLKQMEVLTAWGGTKVVEIQHIPSYCFHSLQKGTAVSIADVAGLQ